MKPILPLLILIVLLTSCLTPYHTGTTRYDTVFDVYVDSYGNDSVCVGKSCVLVPEDTAILTYDLQYREFFLQLKNVFMDKGYNIVDAFVDADYVIYFKYGILEAEDKNAELIPVYGKVGGSSIVDEGDYLDVIAYKSVQHSKPKFYRFLYLTAYDIDWSNKNHERKVVWQAEIESTGGSDDIRRVFPILLTGSERYIGRNSGLRRKVEVHENSRRVAELRANN